MRGNFSKLSPLKNVGFKHKSNDVVMSFYSNHFGNDAFGICNKKLIAHDIPIIFPFPHKSVYRNKFLM